MQAVKVYISHALEDLAARRALEEGLSPLVARGQVVLLPEYKSGSQRLWTKRLLEAMATCDGAVLLLSPAYFSSSFVKKEEIFAILGRNRRCRIPLVPVMVRACDWRKRGLQHFSVLPREGDLSCVDAAAVRGEVKEAVRRWTPLVLPAEPPALPKTERMDISRLPVFDAPFIGRHGILRHLDRCLRNPAVRMVNIIAPEGAGKSALVAHWLRRGIDKRAFAWCFHGPVGAQAATDAFFAHALPFFGADTPLPRDPAERARQLAERLAGEGALLVLDGVDALQLTSRNDTGVCRDPGLNLLFKHVLSRGPGENGLVLVTSCTPLKRLKGPKKSLLQIHLPSLNHREGTSLLHALGVREGLPWEFKRAVEDAHGHALSLLLMGRVLAARFHGDIARRDRLGPWREDGLAGAERVLGALVAAWPPDAPETAFLHGLGLCDRPMEASLWAVLRDKAGLAAPLRVLDQAEDMLKDLRAMGLLTQEQGGEASCHAHPMVRQWFEAHLAGTEVLQDAHAVLFDHFIKLCRKSRPATVADMDLHCRAVYHGCRAGRFHEALQEVRRMGEGGEWGRLLGPEAAGAAVSVLSGFFPHGWERPPVSLGLLPDEQMWLVQEAAFGQMSLGALGDGMALWRLGIQMAQEAEDWPRASMFAQHLGDLLLLTGALEQGLTVTGQAIQWAREAGDPLMEMLSLAREGHVLHRLGRLAESRERFQAAEATPMGWRAHDPRLYGRHGAWYCALLLETGEGKGAWEAVLARGKASLAAVTSPLSAAYDHLTIGRALALLGNPQEAEEHLNQGVALAEQAGSLAYTTPPILLARAAFLHDRGQDDRAWADLERALWIARHCGTLVDEADACLLQARMLMGEGKNAQPPPWSVPASSSRPTITANGSPSWTSPTPCSCAIPTAGRAASGPGMPPKNASRRPDSKACFLSFPPEARLHPRLCLRPRPGFGSGYGSGCVTLPGSAPGSDAMAVT